MLSAILSKLSAKMKLAGAKQVANRNLRVVAVKSNIQTKNFDLVGLGGKLNLQPRPGRGANKNPGLFKGETVSRGRNIF